MSGAVLKEECGAEVPPGALVLVTLEGTGVALVRSDGDTCVVISCVVSLDTGVVGVSEIMAGVLLTVEEDEMSAVAADDVGTPDRVEVLSPTLEGLEVPAVPEVAVSWEVVSVGVDPRVEDEGVDVITVEMVLV